MSRPVKTKPPANLVLTALLSSGITIVLSISYIILCIIALALRYNCDIGSPETISGSQYFWNIIYRVYIQDECGYPISVQNITKEHTVFVLTAITLSTSILTLIAAGVLTSVVKNKEISQYINISVYCYVGACIVSLVVDLTFGIHFGMDYTLLSNELGQSSPGLGMNYQRDVIRQGALVLMSITLKGFIVHAVNIVLLVLLAMYATEYRKMLKDDEQKILKKTPIIVSAYEKNLEDSLDNELVEFAEVLATNVAGVIDSMKNEAREI